MTSLYPTHPQPSHRQPWPLLLKHIQTLSSQLPLCPTLPYSAPALLESELHGQQLKAGCRLRICCGRPATATLCKASRVCPTLRIPFQSLWHLASVRWASLRLQTAYSWCKALPSDGYSSLPSAPPPPRYNAWTHQPLTLTAFSPTRPCPACVCVSLSLVCLSQYRPQILCPPLNFCVYGVQPSECSETYLSE